MEYAILALVNANVFFHESEYCDEMLLLGHYLSSLQKPDNCSNEQFMKIRKRVKSFFLHEGHLWKHPKKEIGHPQRVVCRPEVKKQIIQECHEELWGMVTALKTDKDYLIGVHVIVETDCLPDELYPRCDYVAMDFLYKVIGS